MVTLVVAGIAGFIVAYLAMTLSMSGGKGSQEVVNVLRGAVTVAWLVYAGGAAFGDLPWAPLVAWMIGALAAVAAGLAWMGAWWLLDKREA